MANTRNTDMWELFGEIFGDYGRGIGIFSGSCGGKRSAAEFAANANYRFAMDRAKGQQTACLSQGLGTRICQEAFDDAKAAADAAKKKADDAAAAAYASCMATGSAKLLFINSKTALQWKQEFAEQITRNDTPSNLTEPPPVGGGKKPYFRDCPLEYANAKKIWAKIYNNWVNLVTLAHNDALKLIDDTFYSKVRECYWYGLAHAWFGYSDCLGEASQWQLKEAIKENQFYQAYLKDVNDWYKNLQLDMLLWFTQCCSSVAGISSCRGGVSPQY